MRGVTCSSLIELANESVLYSSRVLAGCRICNKCLIIDFFFLKNGKNNHPQALVERGEQADTRWRKEKTWRGVGITAAICTCTDPTCLYPQVPRPFLSFSLVLVKYNTAHVCVLPLHAFKKA